MARLAGSAGVMALLGSFLPVVASADSPQGTDVRLTDSGPWVAHLVNFNLASIQSVVYYIQDAGNRWRKTEVVTSPPFEAPINWWEGDNNGYEVVTAHVTLTSGQAIKDPGGWHWVDGHHTDPKGSIQAWINEDGTPGALYAPDAHFDDINAVEFWLRDSSGHWHDAGSGSRGAEDNDWLLQSFKEAKPDWRGPENVVSVHVVWAGGHQLVDPTNWATHFASLPKHDPVATSQPTSGTCGDPRAHVYHPDRLRLLAPCVTVTGVIDAIRKEKDGDLHVLLRLDPGQEKYINAKNASEQGDLVLEPVCMSQPTQADAVASCSGYANSMSIPVVGAHVSVTGPWVLDIDHGWLEIHPVSSFGLALTSSPPAQSADPAAASPPAPAPAPPPAPAPAQAPYAAATAAGATAVCADGSWSFSQNRSGTCSSHGGVHWWTGNLGPAGPGAH